MKTEVFSPQYQQISADAIVIGLFEQRFLSADTISFLPRLAVHQIKKLIESGEITGGSGEFTIVHRFNDVGVKRIVVLGLGSQDTFTLELLRGYIHQLVRHLIKINCREICFFTGGYTGYHEEGALAAAISEGFIHGLHVFKKYKSSPSNQADVQVTLNLVAPCDEASEEIHRGARKGKILGQSVCRTREMAEEPGNVMTPAYLAHSAQLLAKKGQVEVTILDEHDMEREGMNLVLAVSRGSAEPAYLIIIQYVGNPSIQDNVTLLGKGITFDSGGISLKRGGHMYEMKRDMTGGAIVFATMEALLELQPKINVTGVIVASENMPGRRAYKPGDIITSMSGKTIEIFSTDAEGRLLLADTLTYIQQYLSPSIIIDIATLTSATMPSLGPRIVPFFSNRSWLTSMVHHAAQKSGENFWELPVFEEYHERVASHFADCKNNSSKSPHTIGAALFLKEFINDELPWIHIDVAAVDTNDKPYSYIPAGATGIGTKTVIELIGEMESSVFADLHAAYSPLQQKIPTQI
ncbi:M17 family metallopeptidase [candidate division CSSED10-310 bacterium]|uniref:Probable cytosol aminopeptidase n=1 Tax=candidate division CSSED10-310 bacterium TaxID=2855610 RepID=A0ABV6YRJ7_UNCC1